MGLAQHAQPGRVRPRGRDDGAPDRPGTRPVPRPVRHGSRRPGHHDRGSASGRVVEREPASPRSRTDRAGAAIWAGREPGGPIRRCSPTRTSDSISGPVASAAGSATAVTRSGWRPSRRSTHPRWRSGSAVHRSPTGASASASRSRTRADGFFQTDDWTAVDRHRTRLTIEGPRSRPRRARAGRHRVHRDAADPWWQGLGRCVPARDPDRGRRHRARARRPVQPERLGPDRSERLRRRGGERCRRMAPLLGRRAPRSTSPAAPTRAPSSSNAASSSRSTSPVCTPPGRSRRRRPGSPRTPGRASSTSRCTSGTARTSPRGAAPSCCGPASSGTARSLPIAEDHRGSAGVPRRALAQAGRSRGA